MRPLDPVAPPEQQVAGAAALVDKERPAPGPLPHAGKARKRAASTGDQASGPLKRPAGYLSGFNLFAKEKRKDFQELYPGTEVQRVDHACVGELRNHVLILRCDVDRKTK